MVDASPKRWQALVGISILCFVVFVDFTIVNTILPGIQRELHATVDQLQWVMNAFFLMLTVFMVTMGRLGDIYGRRRVLYAGVIAFALASLLAGTGRQPAIPDRLPVRPGHRWRDHADLLGRVSEPPFP